MVTNVGCPAKTYAFSLKNVLSLKRCSFIKVMISSECKTLNLENSTTALVLVYWEIKVNLFFKLSMNNLGCGILSFSICYVELNMLWKLFDPGDVFVFHRPDYQSKLLPEGNFFSPILCNTLYYAWLATSCLSAMSRISNPLNPRQPLSSIDRGRGKILFISTPEKFIIALDVLVV